MPEGDERQHDAENDENVGTGDTLDEAATGGEGTDPADGTPPIKGAGQPGQTQSPAAADDVGVPDLDERTE